MTPTPVVQDSPRFGQFYVPRFELKINQSGLPSDVLRDITQITYKDNVKEIDSFEMTVNNWDAYLRIFKYAGGDPPPPTSPLPRAEWEARQKLFEPCGKNVEVKYGYVNEMVTMMTGNFTTMEPNFTSSGAATLAVRGLNVLHQLRKKQYTYAWTNMTISQVAENLGTLTDKKTGKKRFPLRIDAKHDQRADETPETYISQDNQYDIDFLLYLARRRAYDVVVERDSKGEYLYFGPPKSKGAARVVDYELSWGKSLVEFKPTLTTANQIKSVTVRGWNRRTKQPIAETVTIDDPKLNKNKDLKELLGKCDAREEEVVNEPVFTPAQARDRAYAILADRNHDIIKCGGTTVGLPELRAGRHVAITNLGSRFSGIYFITESTHTIDSNGYTTRFSGRREDQQEAKK